MNVLGGNREPYTGSLEGWSHLPLAPSYGSNWGHNLTDFFFFFFFCFYLLYFCFWSFWFYWGVIGNHIQESKGPVRFPPWSPFMDQTWVRDVFLALISLLLLLEFWVPDILGGNRKSYAGSLESQSDYPSSPMGQSRVTGCRFWVFTPQPLRAVGVLFSPMVSGWAGGRWEIVFPGCISETVRCRKLILSRDIG